MAGKRTQQRYKKRLRLRFGAEGANILGFSEDVSQEGLFITTARVQRINSFLTVELTTPDNDTVLLEGRVQWAYSVSPRTARLAKKGGMGIKIQRFISGQEAYRKLCESLGPQSLDSSQVSPEEIECQDVEKIDAIDSSGTEADDLIETTLEKRASPRIRSLHLTSYLPKKGGRQEHIVSIGRTLDVSEGGMKLETHRPLDNGTRVELAIAVEDAVISAEGEVLYSKELVDGLFGTGICFTSMNEEDRQLLR
jgi:hypothetical protein